MILSVIIPTYNEAQTIAELLRRVFAVPVQKEVVVVDDASRDGTTEILRSIEKDLQRNNGRHPYLTALVLVHKPQNEGKGAAIRTAINYVSGDVVLIQDADLELDPQEYTKLLEPMERYGADVVFGSRFRMEGIKRTYRFWHYATNRAFTLFSNMLSGLYLTDMWTCYKVFRTPVLKSLSIESNRFGIEPELVAKIAKQDLNIYEVGVSYHARKKSQGKKIGVRDAVEALWLIIKFNLLR